MLLVRRLLLFQRPLARVLNRQRGDDNQRLAQATFLLRRQQHPPQPGVHRQLRQLPAQFGDAPLLVHRLQLEQQPEAVADLARIRRVHERKILWPPQIQRAHLQNHRRQMGAQNFRIGEGWAAPKVLFRIQPHADARHHPPAAAGALVGAGLGNLLHRQPLNLAARAVAADPRRAGIDDVANAGHGQRGFGDVGRQHDARPATRLEYPVLFGGRQSRVERQHFGIGRMMLAQAFRRLPNLALAGQEEEDVARPLLPHLVHRVENRLLQIAVALILVRRQQRSVAHLHRIGSTRHFDDRRLVEVAGKAFRVDGR